jgi:hypothetical protein
MQLRKPRQWWVATPMPGSPHRHAAMELREAVLSGRMSFRTQCRSFESAAAGRVPGRDPGSRCARTRASRATAPGRPAEAACEFPLSSATNCAHPSTNRCHGIAVCAAGASSDEDAPADIKVAHRTHTAPRRGRSSPRQVQGSGTSADRQALTSAAIGHGMTVRGDALPSQAPRSGAARGRSTLRAYACGASVDLVQDCHFLAIRGHDGASAWALCRSGGLARCYLSEQQRHGGPHGSAMESFF